MQRFASTLSAPLMDGWFAKESVTLVAGDGQANVIVSSEPVSPDIDAEQYAVTQGQLLSQEFPGYLEHSYEEAEIFGGLHGYMRRFEWLPPDNRSIMQLQLYYAYAGRGYTATATTPAESFAANEADMRDVLDGLLITTVAKQLDVGQKAS